MGKFILTSSEQKLKCSVDCSTSAGFTVSGSKTSDKIFYSCYHKLSIKNENFLEIGNDFVSVIGTVIYNDTTGNESLKLIYNDFDGDINAIRDKILGNGAFIIKKGDKITIFSEYLAQYNIFYTVNHSDIIVSNDLYDVCRLCEDLEADTDNLVLKTLMAGVYGKDTEVKGVYCLQDCEKLVIDTLSGELNIEKVEVDWRCHKQMSYGEIVAGVGDFLKKGAAQLAKHFGAPGLSSTGGLDNRLNLAAFLAAGIKPDLYYGVGNSSATNTYTGDLTINRYYQSKFGLNLNVISWKNANPITKDWDEMAKMYGFHSVLYAGSKDLNESYKNINNQLLLFGCFGEIYRIDDNNYLEDLNFADVTLDQYVDLYPIGHYSRDWQLLFKNKERIHNHIKGKLLPMCEKWGIDPNCIKPTDDFLLWLERMHRSDVYVPNLMNRHHYCTFLTTLFPVVKLMSLLHPRDKKNAKFHIDVLNYLCPEIMEVPIFSRCQFQEYDKESGQMLLPQNLRRKMAVRACVKRILPSGFVEILKKLKPNNGKVEKNEENAFDKQSETELLKVFKANGMDEGVDFALSHEGRFDSSLIMFAQELYLFNKLNISFHK